MAPKAAALPGISHVGVSHSDTATQYRHDILYCQIGLPNWIAKSAVRDLSKRDSWHMAYGCKGTYGSVRLGISIDGIRLHTWARVSIGVRVIGKILDNDP
jgi:hypothetical protein